MKLPVLFRKLASFHSVVAFYTAAFVLVALALFAWRFVDKVHDTLMLNVGERLKLAALALVKSVDIEELEELHGPADMDKLVYAEVKRRLIDFANERGLIYAYFIRLTPDGMQFIIDNDIEWDAWDLGIILPLEDAPMQAFGGALSVSGINDTVWGYREFISAFAPVYDKDGSVVAIACVDMRDEQIMLFRSAAKIYSIFLSFTVLTLVLSGISTFRSHNARMRELGKLSQAKTDFLSHMSHEMRTPLNAIIGFSELALNSTRINDYELEDMIKKVHNSGITLLGIINDILDISKVESGRFELIPVEYDVSSLINDVITLNIMRINEKPIKFVVNVDENMYAKLVGDELRIKQIFNNFLSNAFKYTQEGSVEFNLSSERKGADIWVTAVFKDTGIGIRESDQALIFQDFYQADIRANRKIEGTGLGLTITKAMLGFMDGTVELNSVYGQGSAFTVRFRQRYSEDSRLGKDAVENLRNFHYVENKRKRYKDFIRVNLSYAKVLVVDDVETNLEVAKGMMKPYGLNIDCVSSGLRAIELMAEEKERYDAIFMDHMMPDIDGIEATKRIRKLGSAYAKNIPIIALTANAVMGSEAMFLENGFQAFISKPIDVFQLDQALKSWVRDKNKEDESMPEEDKPAKLSVFEGVSIEGVDIDKALSRFAGDEHAYLSVLRSYTANTPPLLDKTRSVSEGELASYAVTVHGIKGISYGIGAQDVGKAAEELEHASKRGDFEFVSSHNAIFEEKAKVLIGNIAAFVATIDSGVSKEKLPYPDREILEKLREACAEYSMDGINEYMEALEKNTYEQGGELVEWLRANVDMMNLSEVAERLEK